MSLYSFKSASGLVKSGRCILRSVLIGTDGTYDPSITVYDNTAASGDEVMPTTTFDASVLGLNGVSGLNTRCGTGLYLEVTCSGATEIAITYDVLPEWG